MRTGCSVQEISYESAREFMRGAKNLILKKDYKYFALIDNVRIVSVLAVKETDKIKLHCNYTPPLLRGKGYFTQLLQNIVERYKWFDIMADCLEASRDIYLRCGFILVAVKEYKHFTIYKVKKKKKG